MKLIEALQLAQQPPRAGAPTFDVALACSITPAHLVTFLIAHLKAIDPVRSFIVREGLYGDLAGNLERSAEDRPDARVVLLEWADLDPRLGLRSLGGWGPGRLDDVLRTAAGRLARLRGLVRDAAATCPLVLTPPTLPLPPVAYHSPWQAGSFELRLRARLADFLVETAETPGVRVVNLQHLERRSPQAGRLNVRSELSAGFPYGLAHASELAGMIARLILPPTPKKGLITDLDDTVWKGILGDVGPSAISWDLDGGGLIHGLYQQVLHALAESGVLVAVASKNDPTIVDEALCRSDLILTREHVFPIEVGWGLKSAAVGRILRAWNVGADSVVFVDDSAMELAEVQAAYPQIEGVLFPRGDDEAAYEVLERLRELFGRERIGAEDAIRLQSLRARAEAGPDAAAPEGADPEEFLRQADAQIAVHWVKEPLNPRALELVNKTNQFNLNGRRYAERAWRDYLDDPLTFLLQVSYKDKYGPLGNIAVLAGRRAGPALLHVDTWVMSCRAFSRRIEHRCLELLFATFGAESITFDFEATPKNGPLRAFLSGVTGRSPDPGLRLTRAEFAASCPPLYHRIDGSDHA